MDAVICAPDRPWLGALVWLNLPDSDAVRAALAAKLTAFNKDRMGGGSTINRLMVLAEPPSAALGEITDKRSINQRRVLERRQSDVDGLYSEAVDARVVLPG
jgi:feruloyl-CoA synthase